MIFYSHKQPHQKDVKAIWKKYTDVENWYQWDAQLEHAYLEGDFEPGTIGALKPKGFKLVKFQLNKIRPYTSFSDTSYLFGARMTFYHKITKTHIEHSVELEGFMSFFYKRIFKKKFEEHMPVAMKKLIETI